MIRHKRTIEQKFKAIVAMIVAMGLVSGFTLQDGTISDAWSLKTEFSPKVLTCTKEEHQHDAACYDESHNLTCEKEEHQHEDASCYCTSHTKGVAICNEDGTHDFQCTNCSDTYTEKCEDNCAIVNNHNGTHRISCNVCTYSSTNTHTYANNIIVANHDGTHSIKCDVCSETQTPVDCTFSGRYIKDGAVYKRVCADCHDSQIISGDAVAIVDNLHKFVDDCIALGFNPTWTDIYEADGVTVVSDVASWLGGLTDKQISDLDALYRDDVATPLMGLAALGSPAYDQIIDYMLEVFPTANDLSNAIDEEAGTRPMTPLGTPPAPPISPLVDPASIDFELLDGSGNEIKNGQIKLTSSSTPSDYVIWDAAQPLPIIVGTPDGSKKIAKTSDGKNIIILANEKIEITEVTAPFGYKAYTEPGTKDSFEVTLSGGSTTVANVLSSTSGVFVLNGTNLALKYELLPEVKLELYKSDDLSNKLTTGASVQLSDGDASPKIVDYNIGDKIVVGTPTGKIEKKDKIIVIKKDTEITVLKGTVPSGYEWVDGNYKFEANSSASITINDTPGPTTFDATGTTMKLVFKKIPIITTKFLEKGTTNALTGCSVILQGTSGSAVLEPGDTIIIGTPSPDTDDISKSGKVITLKAGKDITIKKNIGPLGYQNLEDETFDFSSDASGTITLTPGSKTWVVTASGSEIDIYFDKAPTFKFTTSGDGAPSKTGLKITEKFGAKRTFTVDSATSPSVELADGEYSVTTTSAAKGYKSASGTFTISSGTVSSASGSYSGACEYKADDTVNIKFTKDDKIDDIKVYKYPKKDGKDAPDTKKDALKGWSYTVEMYNGDETTDEKVVKDTKSWDEVDKISVTSSASKDYDTLETSKLTVESYYRIKTGTDTYAYFYINSDGTVKAIKGNIDTNDDGDEIYLWDDDPDEDSDDVIAIHKVNNTGSDLAGAHLQIYLYSDSNTLAYGSSSTASTNTTSSTNNNTNNSSNNTNNSTSGTTTKAKTTPAKPSVATSEVKFDWTSSEKAKVINIDDLEKGKNYTLREVSAPSGYETPAYDFVFKYGTDGKLSIVRNYNGLLSVTGNKLVLKNQTPTEAAATRPKTGDHSKLALWLDICIVMLGGLYLSGYSIFEAFTEKKKVKVVAKKKPNNRRKR